MVNKLIVLFFMDKMDVPLTDEILAEVCTLQNSWLEYMDFVNIIHILVDSGFVYKKIVYHDDDSKKKQDGTIYYSITPDGRACLSYFYTRIPASLRAEITEFVKDNRAVYRRKQEYPHQYHLQPDKTYTCYLKIVDSLKTTLDIRINVSNKNIAKAVAEKWEKENKAAQVYAMLYELLVE